MKSYLNIIDYILLYPFSHSPSPSALPVNNSFGLCFYKSAFVGSQIMYWKYPNMMCILNRIHDWIKKIGNMKEHLTFMWGEAGTHLNCVLGKAAMCELKLGSSPGSGTCKCHWSSQFPYLKEMVLIPVLPNLWWHD